MSERGENAMMDIGDMADQLHERDELDDGRRHEGNDTMLIVLLTATFLVWLVGLGAVGDT
jgi:hypothetical protein